MRRANFTLPSSPFIFFHKSLACAADENLLSPDEILRADALRLPQERRRFVAARVLTRQVLAEQMGISPREVVFAYGAHGKPSVSLPTRQETRGENVYFSTARSEDDWVCAISRQGEMGVDVERVRELPELDALIRAYCAKREQLALRALSIAQSALARNFLQCWTRKEAVLKALGAGLSIPPNQIDVFSDDEETEVMAQGRRWRARSLGLPSADGAGEALVALAWAVTAHAP